MPFVKVGGGQGFGDFGGGFSDIFEEFFGGGFGGQSRQRGPQRGNDLRYNMSVSLQEAYSGKKSQIRIPSYEGCDLCSATGSADKLDQVLVRHVVVKEKLDQHKAFFL